MTKETLRKLQQRRQRCEVYSRAIGYIRPVSQWHQGKRAEFKDRKLFEVETGVCPTPAGSNKNTPKVEG